MYRSALFGVVLAASLSSGCATMNLPGGDDGIVEMVRSELESDPDLNSSQIVVTEDAGEVVLSGFAESLEDRNAILDIVTDVDGVVSVRNEVIVQQDG